VVAAAADIVAVAVVAAADAAEIVEIVAAATVVAGIVTKNLFIEKGGPGNRTAFLLPVREAALRVPAGSS
jgi:hypothetical protein